MSAFCRLTNEKENDRIIAQSRFGALSVAEWDVVCKRKQNCCGAKPRPLRIGYTFVPDLRLQEVFLWKKMI